MAKLTARGDFDKFLLTPDFTDEEAEQLAGKMGLAIATDEDLKAGLPTYEMTKEDIKEAAKKARR